MSERQKYPPLPPERNPYAEADKVSGTEKPDPEYIEYYDDGCEAESDDDANCGLGRDGQCGLAGSEHCDFDCPFRESSDFSGSAAWVKAHCTCAAPPANPRGQDPYSEPKVSRNCPVHGDD